MKFVRDNPDAEGIAPMLRVSCDYYVVATAQRVTPVTTEAIST